MQTNISLQQNGVTRIVENPLSENDMVYMPTKSALAHEVRNPLTNINLSVEMLRSMRHSPSQERFLDIISRASSEIANMVNILLIPSQNGTDHHGKYSIHKFLDEVLTSAEDRIFLKHIHIRKDYGLQDCEIELNQPEMKIALTNIIVNAIEAINHDHGVLKVSTKCQNDKCFIQVQDNGCGISKEHLKNIFNPYFTSKAKGLGLGLAATADILRSNHCSFSVESVVNEGTCFEISLDRNC